MRALNVPRSRLGCWISFPLLVLLVFTSFMIVHDPQLSNLEKLLCMLRHHDGRSSLSQHSAGNLVEGTQTLSDQEMSAARQGLAHGVLLHQTVRSLRLTPKQREWQLTWERLGFRLLTADDAAARRDIERMAEVTGSTDFLRVYDALETRCRCTPPRP